MSSDAIIVLPGEVIVHILEDERLSFSDIVHFSLSCRSLYKIVNENNKLWKTKFFQRYIAIFQSYYCSNKN